MARYGERFYTFTAVAAADLSAHMYQPTAFTAKNTVGLATDPTAHDFAGILINNPRAGEHATIWRGGWGKVVAGASIDPFKFLTVTSSSRVTEAAAGELVIGRSLEGAVDLQVMEAEIFETPWIWVEDTTG